LKRLRLLTLFNVISYPAQSAEWQVKNISYMGLYSAVQVEEMLHKLEDEGLVRKLTGYVGWVALESAKDHVANYIDMMADD
jgi:hypothetical protein